MSTTPPPPSRRPSTGMVERLYVLWVVSSLLLVLLVVVVTLFGSGQLRRHAARISEQSQAIDQLRDDLSLTRRELENLKATVAYAAPAPRAPPIAPEEPRGPTQLTEDEPLAPQPAPTATVAPDDDAINALLNSALRESDDMPYELADRAAAEGALWEGLAGAGRTAWSGQTWARLAVVACLLDRDEPAKVFAASTQALNEIPYAYYEISARKLLAKGRGTEAIVFARRLAASRPSAPQAALLLAEACRLNGHLAAADVALEKLDNIEPLSSADKLRLGRLFVALERWNRLDALLGSLDEVPQPALPQLNHLRAVLAIQQGRLPEALAILDNLLTEQPEGGAGVSPAYPDDYELRTWRGVVLLYAGQFRAAREALAHAQEHRDRPEAWYWRGVLENRAGNPDEAIRCLDHALAASHDFAPAWEALGLIALNRGDLPTALLNLTNAVNVNPRRPSAHFLLALSHAKASRPRETLEALRRAFHLDPSLLEAARQAGVITRMFSEDELAALARAAVVAPPSPVESDEGEPD
ncbi:MAG: tetratricopeptide repeat protein [Phycisphaerae bacterium]